MRIKLNFLSSLLMLCAFFAVPCLTVAQTNGGPSPLAQLIAPRVTQPVDESNLVVLHGNTHPLALPKYDQGAAPASLPMQRMLLVLHRSATQESALEQLLEQQQDNSSPNYHQWLTPQQFGAQFGPADQDIQTVTAWLQSHGFQVARVSAGRVVIEFSGTAGQVAEAFHTSIHKYAMNGEEHWANASDPQIPAALAPVIAGVRSLHNFPARPMNHPAGVFHKDAKSGRIVPSKPLPIPQYTPGSGCGILGGPCEYLGPYDLAAIYDVSPLWNATTPIDGTGQTIAIVGETDINPADWTAFWNMFGVSTPKGKLNIIVDGPDPGTQSDESEADIDTQWSSAVAKGATIDFVESESTESTLGVDLSAEYIVDNNLAPVMSESYGICELFIGTAGNTYYNTLWQQASAQGITVFVSSGDQGSAVCDRGDSAAEFGLAVNGFGSTPYNVAVGGTDFNDLTTTANYWSAIDNSNQANALGYIPEETWNDTCTNSEIFPYLGTTTAAQTCASASAQNDGFVSVTGGSGGVSACTSSNGQFPSSCTGGNAKPSWQTGTGVPNDGHRDVPDVSLFASNGFNNSGYIVCESDLTGVCNLSDGDFLGFGGTSVSSPAFAGIMALVNQKMGERQGNANYVFYKTAAGSGNSCNSNSVSSTGTNNCIFYDIPTGSTIAMPCTAGSPNCTVANGNSIGVLSGYATGTGYDLATGLGTVNVANLVNQWSTYAGQFKATTTSPFTLGPPTTITHGQSIPVAATVKPQTGTGTPTGTITLIANTGATAGAQTGVQQTFALVNGSIAVGSTTTMLPGGTNYTVTAHYSGDGTFAPSDSTPFTMTVNPEASKTQVMVETYDATSGQITNLNAKSFTYGTPTILRANVTNSSGNLCAPTEIETYGCPTGSVTLTDTLNGTSSQIGMTPFGLNSEGYTEDQSLFLLGGSHSIVASYNGDNSFNASTVAGSSDPPDVVIVNPAPTTITLTPSPNPANIGTVETLTAVVEAQVIPPSNSASYLPTGAVKFFNGTTQLSGTVNYSILTNPTVEMLAYLNTTLIPLGDNSITAQFVGDSNYAASPVSNNATVDIVIPTTTTLTASSSTIQHGSPVTFTATITPQQGGGPAMTGFVAFTASGNILGNVAVANGKAQVTTSALPGPTVVVVATYNGDVNYGTSAANLTETVNLIGTTIAVTSSSPTVPQYGSVTLTASITPAQSGGPTLTGQVLFTNGSDGTYGVGTVVNNQAQTTTALSTLGATVITVIYPGDSNYATSTTTITETVTPPPTFTATANPSTIVVASPGSSGSAMITFTSLNGYSGTIPLSPSLCINFPAKSSCTFSVSSVSLDSTSQTTEMVTLTVSTTAPSAASPQSRWQLSPPRFLPPIFRLTMVCVFCLALMIVRLGSTARRWRFAFAAFAFATVLVSASCGGGGNSGPPPPPPNPGTPVGLDQSAIISFDSAGVSPSPQLSIPVNVQ